VTGSPDIRVDLRNAGADVVEDQAVGSRYSEHLYVGESAGEIGRNSQIVSSVTLMIWRLSAEPLLTGSIILTLSYIVAFTVSVTASNVGERRCGRSKNDESETCSWSTWRS